MFILIRIYFLFCLFLLSQVQANILSETGNIFIDSDNDGAAESVIQADKVGISTLNPLSKLHVEGNVVIEGEIGISGEVFDSSIHNEGSFGINHQSISSNVEINGNSWSLVSTQISGNITLTLPEASAVTGRLLKIKSIYEGDTIFIKSNSLIDEYAEISLSSSSEVPFPYVELFSNGNQWYIMNEMGIDAGPSNLVAWYTFDETSGNTLYDKTGNSSNGTLNGGFSFSSNSLVGQFGNALSFNGSSDFIDLGDADELFFSTQVTIAAWVRPFTHDIGIWEKSNNFAYGHITLEFDGFGGNPHPYFRVNGSDFTLRSAQADATAATSDWVHVVGRYRNSDGEVSIFINGVKQADTETMTATTPGVASSYRRTLIGAMSNAGTEFRFYSGYMDDLRFYSSALTDSEILFLYNAK